MAGWRNSGRSQTAAAVLLAVLLASCAVPAATPQIRPNGDASVPPSGHLPDPSAGPVCPAPGALDGASLAALGGAGALACYGRASLTFVAQVACTSVVADGGVGGVPWRDSYRRCAILDDEGERRMALFGAPMTAFLGEDTAANPVTGTFRITAHVDDPLAVRCGIAGLGVSLDAPVADPDPAAVAVCRTDLVVTEAVRLD